MLEGAILGFDVGTKRIGVALGHTLTAQVRPLATLTRLPGGVVPWSQVRDYVHAWNVSAIVVGIPFNMDGSDQKITQICREFARSCRQELQLPVFGVDERLSTVEARQRVFDQSGYRGLKKAEIDSVAAALLIEQWLLSGQVSQEVFE